MSAQCGADVIREALGKLLVVNNGAPESVAFVPNGERMLSGIVDRYLDSEELLGVVSTLMESMYLLEVEGRCPNAAKIIASVIEREQVTRPLKQLGSRWRANTAKDRVAGALEQAEEFSRKRSKWV